MARQPRRFTREKPAAKAAPQRDPDRTQAIADLLLFRSSIEPPRSVENPQPDDQNGGRPTRGFPPAPRGLRSIEKQQAHLRRLLASDDFGAVIRRAREEALKDGYVSESTLQELVDEFGIAATSHVLARLLSTGSSEGASDDVPEDLRECGLIRLPAIGQCRIVRGSGTDDEIPVRSDDPPHPYDLRLGHRPTTIEGIEAVLFRGRDGADCYETPTLGSGNLISWKGRRNRPSRNTPYYVRFRYEVRVMAENTLVSSPLLLDYERIRRTYSAADLAAGKVLFVPVDVHTQLDDIQSNWESIRLGLRRRAWTTGRRYRTRKEHLADLEQEAIKALGKKHGRFERIARILQERGGTLWCAECQAGRWYPGLGDCKDRCPKCAGELSVERVDLDILTRRIRQMAARKR